MKVRLGKRHWLVVGPPLWKIWTSIGMIRNSQYFWENKIHGNQTTNQKMCGKKNTHIYGGVLCQSKQIHGKPSVDNPAIADTWWNHQPYPSFFGRIWGNNSQKTSENWEIVPLWYLQPIYYPLIYNAIVSQKSAYICAKEFLSTQCVQGSSPKTQGDPWFWFMIPFFW